MAEINFEDKIKFLEQKYFTHDLPIPFKRNLKIYPVLVKDYYNFYSLISCFTLDKNADIKAKGVKMTHLGYIFHLIEQEGEKHHLINQFFSLLSLVFKEENTLICSNPDCDEGELTFEQIWEDLEKYEKEEKKKLKDITDEKELLAKLKRLQMEYLQKIEICPICGSRKREKINIMEEKGTKHLYIGHTEITNKDFDELRKIVCYQNIPDFDDDYIDPDLKKDLEEVARLKNPNNVQPTLEKQESCIVSSSPYKFSELQELSIRRFVLLLRTIDTKLHYFAYRQAEASGMVSFKGELDHWIYSNTDHKKNKFKDLLSVDAIKEKFSAAT